MGRAARRLAIILLALAAWPAARAADLAIGFVGDLSGVGANVAQDQLDGFRLGIKHLGGRLAGLELTVVVADSHRDAHAARLAVERMQQGEHIQAVLVSAQPAVYPALLPLAATGRSILIALASPPPSLAGKECSPWLFSLAGLADTPHEVAGAFLQQRGFHTVAVAGLDDPATQAVATLLRRGFKGQLTVVGSRRGQMDFTTDLKAIGAMQADAIYLVHTGGMAVNFIRQMEGVLGKDHPVLVGPPTTLDQTLLAAAGVAALDAWSVAPWSEDFDVPSSRRVIPDFESDYGRPASLFAMIGYDAALALDGALRAADKRFNDPDVLRQALRRGDFPSTRGSFHFDTNQFPILTYVARQVVSDPRERMVNEQRGLIQRDVRDGHAGECPIRWTAEPPPKG
jgi:branched-chain amino acid transport system substrate-binding protein